MCLCISKLCYSNISNVYDPSQSLDNLNNLTNNEPITSSVIMRSDLINEQKHETKSEVGEYELINFTEYTDNINEYDIIESNKEFGLLNNNKIESNIIHNLKIISSLTLDDKLWINENGLFEIKDKTLNWLLNYSYIQPVEMIILTCDYTITQALDNPNKEVFIKLLESSLTGFTIMMSIYPSKVNEIQIIMNKIKRYLMRL